MKAKFGSIIVDGRNKLGGSIYSKNRYGNYSKTFVNPTNTITSYRTANRASFAAISQSWRNLTEDQRNGWNSAVFEYAKTDIFGDLRNPSGYNLYMRVNCLRNIFSLAIVNDAPSPVVCSLSDVQLQYMSVDSEAVQFGFSFVAVGYDRCYAKISRGLSAGINYAEKWMVNAVCGMSPTSAGYSSETFFYNHFGSWPAIGESIHFRVFVINSSTGQSCNFFYRKIIRSY